MILPHHHHRRKAFTLIELLAVIVIIGIIAGIVAPSLSNIRKGDVMLSGTRQMLDAVARARQLAISQRTTVYLVFVPPGFWNDPAYAFNKSLTLADRIAATNLAGLQYIGYNYVVLRSVGDQPGQGVPRYLSSWQTLPNSTFIAADKFWNLTRTAIRGRAEQAWFIRTNFPPNVGPPRGFDVYGFEWTTNLPFPLPETKPYRSSRPWAALPYIAFDYLGRVKTELREGTDGEFIPLAHGGVSPAIDPTTRGYALGAMSAATGEVPRLNSSNSFNLIHVDWLTGRGRLEQKEVR